MSQPNPPPPATNDLMPSSTQEISLAQNQTAFPENTEEITPTPQTESSINPRPRKTSGWKILKTIFIPTRGRKAEPKPTPPAAATRETQKNPEENECLSNLILGDIRFIQNTHRKWEEEIKSLLDQVPENPDELNKLQKEDLKDLRNTIFKLRLLFSTEEKHYKKLKSISSHQQSTREERLLELLPNLYENPAFQNSAEYLDFVDRYNKLPSASLKLCLLCFSVFPENAVIKKRLMLHWWVADGFAVDVDRANGCFLELIEKGFVQPVNENQRPSIKMCRIHPFCRSVLVNIAGGIKFFNFDREGNPTEDFLKSLRSCLVGEGLLTLEIAKKTRIPDDLQKTHHVFNVSEQILDFDPLISKMKNVNILHLGRWSSFESDRAITLHNEDGTKVFMEKGSANMKYLKLLSLQGVSKIQTFHGASMKEMTNLKFLDLKYCGDLSFIPSDIMYLRSLSHLDISHCNRDMKMPKELSDLKNLEVLKGFIIRDKSSGCTLSDLKMLQKLIKLSLNTDSSEFPNRHHLGAIREMRELQKLTVTWDTTVSEARYESDITCNYEEMRLPSKLEKLELRSFPTSRTLQAPKWLQPRNLKEVELKKLYIIGGNFTDLGQYQETGNDREGWSWGKMETWKVEKLRLRYLHEMEIEWDQLRELFPKLDFLEHLHCPKLKFFPCHANELEGEANVTDREQVSFSWKKNRTS